MHVRRLHAQLLVATVTLLLVGSQIAVDKLAYGLRQGRLLAQWSLVAGLALQIGRKRLVALGACRYVFIHIGLHRLAAHAQFPGHGTDGTRGLIHADDVLSLYHVKHSFKALQLLNFGAKLIRFGETQVNACCPPSARLRLRYRRATGIDRNESIPSMLSGTLLD